MLEQSQIEAIIAKLRERFNDLVVDTRDYGRTTGSLPMTRGQLIKAAVREGRRG